MTMTKTEAFDIIGQRADFIRTVYKPLVQYLRDRKGRKVGCLLAYRDPAHGALRVGWSRCHVGRDNFDRGLAVTKAFDRAVPIDELDLDAAPHSARAALAHFAARARRFYR